MLGLYLLRRNIVKLVVLYLLGPAAIGLVYGLLHGSRNGVSVHDNQAVNVTRSAAGRLRKRAAASQEALFVSVQNCYK